MENKIYSKWWFWGFACIILFTVCMTIIITYANSHPAIIRFETNAETRDSIEHFGKIMESQNTENLDLTKELYQCQAALDTEKANDRLCRPGYHAESEKEQGAYISVLCLKD